MTAILVTLLLGVVSSIVANFITPRARGVSLLTTIPMRRRRLRPLSIKGGARGALLAWLKRDLAMKGPHSGEFGELANPAEEKEFQVGRTYIYIKPRLYLTGWPTFVLTRHGLAPDLLRTVSTGMRRLFSEAVVTEPHSALSETNPAEQPVAVSYRHTIRAVQILIALGASANEVAPTIGRMLDSRETWQNEDGGWAQAEHLRPSDLWASAYAAGLLATLQQTRYASSLGLEKVVTSVFSRSVSYLEAQWQKNKWSYGGLFPEQNAPMLFHEIANATRLAQSTLRHELQLTFQNWLTPTGTLCSSYFTRTKNLALSSANARLAYALHLLSMPKESYERLWQDACSTFGPGVNSADVAFLIDLSFVFEK